MQRFRWQRGYQGKNKDALRVEQRGDGGKGGQHETFLQVCNHW